MAYKPDDFSRTLGDVLRDGFTPLMGRVLRFFLRNPYQSLVIINKECRLEFADRGSEKFFGLAEGGAKGMKITDLVPNSYLPKVVETGEPAIGTVFNVRGIPRIGSAFPLIRDGEIVGAMGMVFFRSLEEVERINRKIVFLNREVESLRNMQKDQHRALYTFDSILGISKSIKDVLDLAKKVAMIESDVLIVGESGTGKELLAHGIHNYAAPERPFVWVNSPAIPFELAESELFGYEKGAFSGASTTGKPGKFELAHNGTIFLDEISSLPLSIQAKLLRVLQNRQVERLGSTRSQKLRFRVIAATNVDLMKLVREGKFREDLYYRVAKASIRIPRLSERNEDILIYANHYLGMVNARFGTSFKRLSREAALCFIGYDWPGNVRELINVLEQAALKKWDGDEIPADALPPELTRHAPMSAPLSLRGGFRAEKEGREKELVLKALEETGGNKRKASSLLGISRSTLYKKLHK